MNYRLRILEFLFSLHAHIKSDAHTIKDLYEEDDFTIEVNIKFGFSLTSFRVIF